MQRFSVNAPYDPQLDCRTWSGFNPSRMNTSKDPKKKAFALAKMQSGARDHRSKISAITSSKRKSREEAEARAAELVRKVVQALEFSMQELIETSAPSTYEKSINQLQLHNAIFFLKTKCGVKFIESEFDPYIRKAALDHS